MTFDFAQEAFRSTPSKKTAGWYLETAVDYESDDMIGDDTFLDAIGEVSYWLIYGKLIMTDNVVDHAKEKTPT